MTKTQFGPGITDLEAAQQIEIQVKYAGYIDRQEDEIARQLRQEVLKIPANFDSVSLTASRMKSVKNYPLHGRKRLGWRHAFRHDAGRHLAIVSALEKIARRRNEKYSVKGSG